MPYPEKARGPWIYACYRVLLCRPVRLLVLVLGVTGASFTGSAEAVMLNEVRVGNHGDYIRIVFELSGQAKYQIDEDTGAIKISIRFWETNTTIPQAVKTVQAGCLEEVATLHQDDQVVAQLRLNSRWHKLKPFTLREPDRMVLDIFCGQDVATVPSQTEIKTDPATQTPEDIAAEKPATNDSGSVLTQTQPVEKEAQPTVADETPVIESTTPSSLPAESRIEESLSKTGQVEKPVASANVAPRKKDPFQKYLLILLAAITGVIIILIALIVIQKKSQSTGSESVGHAALADPDQTMRAIDQQIKTKLMKYDDQ